MVKAQGDTIGPLIPLIGGKHEAVVDVCVKICPNHDELIIRGEYCSLCPVRTYTDSQR